MSLINLHDREKLQNCMVPVGKAGYPEPFRSGLEYSAPARGGWTIVHIGFLMPEAHEIFVCGKCCLRGVVLSAAELDDTERFSTITVDEESVREGSCEQMIIDGVSGILDELPKMPKAVQLFTSCVHHFLGTDLSLVFRRLKERYPDVGFVQCWMNPIMRKTKMAPVPFMKKQLYALLENTEKQDRTVNIIGNNLAMEDACELPHMLETAGWKVRDICTCRSFEEYREMERSVCNIVTNPLGLAAAKELKERLGQPYCYLPVSFDFDKIEQNYKKLENFLKTEFPEQTEHLCFPPQNPLREKAEQALKETAAALKGYEVFIDYMVTGKPLGLAKFLLLAGVSVKGIYIDSISGEEEEEFKWLQEYAPELELWATVHHSMALVDRRQDGKILAIGQKAAYFTGTKHFVNQVEDGGLYGYGGLLRWCEKIREALLTEREAEAEIQVKGWECHV